MSNHHSTQRYTQRHYTDDQRQAIALASRTIKNALKSGAELTSSLEAGARPMILVGLPVTEFLDLVDSLTPAPLPPSYIGKVYREADARLFRGGFSLVTAS